MAMHIEKSATSELAEQVMRRCDQDDYQTSVPLRELALAATQKCLEAHRSRYTEPSEDQRAERARLANNLGQRLSDLGRREDALEATREAVDIRRQLAEARPDAFLPDLAASLNNLGNMLSELGRREDALEATREAVDHYRQLAEARPEDALEAVEEALRHLTPFYLRYPDAFGDWMRVIVRSYTAWTTGAGQEPDSDLLQPILRILEA